MLKIIAVRHGNAAPMVGGDDFGRPLSTKGIAQANARAASVATLGRTRLVLASPALRAIETAQAVFPGFNPVIVSELYLPIDPIDNQAGEEAFAKLGYATLRTYIAQDTGWLGRWGWNAVRGIRRELAKYVQPNLCDGTPFVGIVGHAVYSNMVGAMLYTEHAEKLFDIQLGEAEALVLRPDAELVHLAG